MWYEKLLFLSVILIVFEIFLQILKLTDYAQNTTDKRSIQYKFLNEGSNP